MTDTTDTAKALPADLPIPREQLFYADAALNIQEKTIKAYIDFIHYPTLGCPALLGPDQNLQVLLSLPASVDPGCVAFHLADHHDQADPEKIALQNTADPEHLGDGPGGARKLWRFRLDMANAPFALYDLHAVFDGGQEVQYNSVRRYETITGSERIILGGDSQFHDGNGTCLDRFIERVNKLDIAWIAVIGDVCDNGVKNPLNIAKLAVHAGPGDVKHYYEFEYVKAHKKLRSLRHPVVLVPGNHDGMTANPRYETDPFPDDKVEYDGLKHFRRTFGPPYFSFDWGNTRYVCTNTFEMDSQQRLGYHAIVANWGGWMRDDQLAWIKREFDAAKALGHRKVMLMHHDPRGGSKGNRLGRYHKIRRFKFDGLGPILKAYLAYLLKHGRKGWQQEWMLPANAKIEDHPVKELLRAMLDHEVWAVVMGHDNENWIDSYFDGDDLFETNPSSIIYAIRSDVANEADVDDVLDFLKSDDFGGLSSCLEQMDPESGEAALSAAIGELQQAAEESEIAFSSNPAQMWELDVKSAIHFVHVDDIGAYKHSKESHFDEYGFVVATLEGGSPQKVQSQSITGKVRTPKTLEVD
jgi:hypothetical protein